MGKDQKKILTNLCYFITMYAIIWNIHEVYGGNTNCSFHIHIHTTDIGYCIREMRFFFEEVYKYVSAKISAHPYADKRKKVYISRIIACRTKKDAEITAEKRQFAFEVKILKSVLIPPKYIV